MKMFRGQFKVARSILTVTLLVFVSHEHSMADPRTWQGDAGNPNWSDLANWLENAVPEDGDDLIFPANAVRKDPVNTLGPIQIRSIRIEGGDYAISSSSQISLSGGIVSLAGQNRIVAPINLTAPQIFDISNVRLTLDGTVSGTGGVTKLGSGILEYVGTGDNIYSGDTFVRSGILRLSKSGAFALNNSALLNIGDSFDGTAEDKVVYMAANQLRSTVNIKVNRTGVLDLNGFADDVGDIELVAGEIRTGAGTLILLANVVASSQSAFPSLQFFNSRISGNLTLGNVSRTFTVSDSGLQIGTTAPDLLIDAIVSGAATLIKEGSGELELASANPNFTGPVTINAGTLVVSSDGALGGTAAAVSVNNSGCLTLKDSVDINHPLVLNSDAPTGTLFSPPAALASRTGENVWLGPIQLARYSTIHVGEDSQFALAGVISQGATEAGLTKTGDGELELISANTFNGVVAVNDGVLDVRHAQALGSTIGDTIVNQQGTLEITGGLAISANEELALNTDGSVDALRATIGSNYWAGAVVLMEPAAGISVLGGATLSLGGQVSGTAPANGVIKTDAGHLWFVGSLPNTYSGRTTVDGGTVFLNRSIGSVILGDLTIGQPLAIAPLRSVVVRELDRGQISNGSAVMVNRTGLLDLQIDGNTDDIGSLAGSGAVRLTASRLRCGANGLDTRFTGIIEGDGGLSKVGASIMTLTGNNTYTGETRIGGTLFERSELVINGQQTNSPVVVNEEGILSGVGRVGTLSGRGGTIRPGDPGADRTGRLTCGNLDLDANTTFEIELDGTAVGEFDQLAVIGTCALNDARLSSRQTAFPFVLQRNMQFLIIDNDGSDPILPDMFVSGSAATLGNAEFSVDYNGDNNLQNDVTLRLTGFPLENPSVPTVDAGNGNNRFDPDECNELRIRLRNEDFESQTIQGISARLESDHPDVYITQPDSEYPPIAHVSIMPNGQSPDPDGELNLTPFQVSAFPSLQCGIAIPFRLVVTTSSHGTFILELSMQVGIAGLCQPGTGMCAMCPVDFTIQRNLRAGGLPAGPAYTVNQNDRLCIDAEAHPCNPNTLVPFHSYLFQNNGRGQSCFSDGCHSFSCIEVILQTPCAGFAPLVSGAIVNPANDTLDNCPATVAGTRDGLGSYFFIVPRDAQFLVFVQAPSNLAPCGEAFPLWPYTLTVRARDEQQCEPPRMFEMQRAGNQNKITYSTAAPKYRLQSAPSLNGPWSSITQQLHVQKSRYVLTNNSQAPMQFYRLHKP